MSAHEEILFEHRGGVLIVTLNRPRALNALSRGMCEALSAGLEVWRTDDSVHAVLVKGAGERAFCAGGDIRSICDVLAAKGAAEAAAFYATEYQMNTRLHRFTKPYVALLDGITMGGGVGVSIHGSHRVATERTLLAMPETGIGFFPDVGATYVLPRLRGALGLYLGLTGARMQAADCLYAGLATHFVAAARLTELEAALAETDLAADAHAQVDAVLGRFVSEPPPTELPKLQPLIDACFDQPSLEAVLEALAREPSGWGRAQLEQLQGKSPTSLAVTFQQLRTGATLGFEAAMQLEYRLVHRFMAGHDFREGVRALLVDKDNSPRWRPSHLQDIIGSDLEVYFADLPHGDLQLNG